MTTPTHRTPVSRTTTYTYFQPDGNRIVAGRGTFPNVTSVDYPVTLPTWVIGSPEPTSSAWLVTSDQGEVRRIRPNGSITVGQTAPRQPIAGRLTGEGFVPLLVNTDRLPFALSALTHPVVIPSGLLMITADGDLVLWNEDAVNPEFTRLSASVLPDARLAVLPDAGLAAVYVEPTDRYPHGVLGDSLEAAALIILKLDDLSVVTRIALPEEEVFEGIQPLWADIDSDGQPELVTTVSTATHGARIRVYRMDGSVLVQGEGFSRGGRWRHQLAFGAFGPEGENELVVVRTPHASGIVEYYRYQDGQLTVVAEIPGFTSHVLHTRNLAMAVAGDFNGDGRLELAIPDQEREIIAGIQRTADDPDGMPQRNPAMRTTDTGTLRIARGAEVIWSVSVGGLMVTNIAAMPVTDSTGAERLAIAVGTSEDRLRVWR